MVSDGAMLSFVLALWMTWLVLRGLFRLMPVTSTPVTDHAFRPIRFVANRHQGNRRRDAA